MKKVVIASDSFKGCLSSQEVAAAASEAVRCVFPSCEIRCLTMADGGEGTAEALGAALGGDFRTRTVRGPLGDPVEASYLVTGSMAVIEMARASGLTLVPPQRRSPALASTYGTGELIADALGRGCRDCLVCIGGSATNDGGMGALAALGWRFLDAAGEVLEPVGASLGKVARIEGGGAIPALKECRFRVACDVDTPFFGPSGAAAVFAPQKGADAATVRLLEEGMAHFAAVVRDATGVDIGSMPGAGAAGGLGGALHAFLGAELLPGAEMVLDALGFDALAAGADLVITGEGRMDGQTLHGKAPAAVLARAQRLGVPVLALVGSLAGEKPAGFRDVLTVTPPGMPTQWALWPETARLNIVRALQAFLVNAK